MQFTPQSDAEIAKKEREAKERWCWPVTQDYDFDINTATEKEGDYGLYFEFETTVYHPNGEWKQNPNVFVGAGSPKLKSLCYAIGLEDRYEAGQLDADDFYGKSGKCKLSIQRDKNKIYPDRNKISDFVRAAKKYNEAPEVQKSKAAIDPKLDDVIPF